MGMLLRRHYPAADMPKPKPAPMPMHEDMPKPKPAPKKRAK